MKEFTSQVGGRYTYIDDILNLQELSLAITSLFAGCDNFIISGCQVTGSTLSEGYVFINGKIRYCAKTAGISTWPVYIFEHNTVEKVSYADSGDKIGRNVYGCTVGSSVPTSADPLTGSVPQFIQVTSDGTAMRLKDAFFGKYALTINSAYNSQTVHNNMVLDGNLDVKGVIQSENIEMPSGNNKGEISYTSDGNLIIRSSLAGQRKYQMTITNDGAFKFYAGETLIATLTESGFVVSVPITSSIINAGAICIDNNDIYNCDTTSNDGALRINMLGHNGSNGYYRDTFIGDGKNTTVLTIRGQQRLCQLSGSLAIFTSQASPLNITHNTMTKTDKRLQSYINWQDSNGNNIAQFGYTSATDNNMYIHNKIGNVHINGDTYIEKSLYVGGLDVMAIMATKTDVTLGLRDKADVSSVYTKADADKIFIKRADGIGVFVREAGGGETGKQAVRTEIGAASLSDMDKAVLKSQLFKDIVAEGLPDVSNNNYVSALESRQRSLCENIGAVYKADAQLIPKDTGWKAVTMYNNTRSTLYVRQIGHMVCIQGELYTPHEGLIFTLPNTIDPPTYKIGYSYNNDGRWSCYLASGSRQCMVAKCAGGCKQNIGFLMTYLV